MTTSPIKYSEVGAANKVTLTAANATYANGAKSQGYDSNSKVYIEGVNNALTVEATAGTGKTANVYVSGDSINASTAITKTGTSGSVDVYLGGTSTAAGTTALDLKGIANASLVSDVNKVYAYTKDIITLKTAAALGASTKLDLSKVDAKIAFDTAATDDVTLTNIVDNANSGDSITLKLAVTASDKSFVGTAGKDTFDIQTTQNQKVSIALGNNDKAADVVKYAHTALTGFKADTITNFGTEDKINLKALGLATLTDASSKVTDKSGDATIETGKIYQVEITDWTTPGSGKAAATIAVDDLFGASSKVFNTTADTGVSALVVAKGNDNAYAIFAVKSNDGTITTASEVTLIATVDGAFTASNYDIA